MELKDLYIHLIPIGIILLVSIIVHQILRRTLIGVEKRQKGNADRTKFNFLKNSVGIVVYSVAIILIINSIPGLRSLGTALFAGAGVIAAIVGFASQAAFSNIVSGVFIIIFKPFRVGDIVRVNTLMGTVTDITFRHTVIKDFENQRIIIPNSIISNETIVNASIGEESIRRHINLGISYDSNVDEAIAIIKEEIEKHPKFMDNRSEEDIENGVEKVPVKLTAWSDSSINLRAFVWTASTGDAFALQCDILKSIKERFDQVGIEIPYPHRSIVMKNA